MDIKLTNFEKTDENTFLLSFVFCSYYGSYFSFLFFLSLKTRHDICRTFGKIWRTRESVFIILAIVIFLVIFFNKILAYVRTYVFFFLLDIFNVIKFPHVIKNLRVQWLQSILEYGCSLVYLVISSYWIWVISSFVLSQCYTSAYNLCGLLTFLLVVVSKKNQ